MSGDFIAAENGHFIMSEMAAFDAYVMAGYENGATREHCGKWLSEIEHVCPGAFALFYPRIYQSVGPYYSPKMLAASCAFSTMMVITASQLGHIDEVMQQPAGVMYPSLCYVADKGMPTLFLDPGFVEALKHTEIRDPIKWLDLKLPYEHGILAFPVGSVKSGTLYSGFERECAFVCWSRSVVGNPLPPPPGIDPRKMPPDHLVEKNTLAISVMMPGMVSWLTLMFRNPEIVLGAALRGEGDVYRLDESTGEPERFAEECVALTLGAILAMHCRPELIVSGKRLKRCSGRKGNRQFWTPNIVGGNYQPKSEPGGGTHMSPRMHWRRGHFRNQACGVGRKEHKVIWLEPVLVAAPASEPAATMKGTG